MNNKQAEDNMQYQEVIRTNRNGLPVIRQLIKTDKNGTKYWVHRNVECTRCGGSGHLPFNVEGGVCFRCWGKGTEPKNPVIKEYTPEYEAKLTAKRAAKAEAKRLAKLVEDKAYLLSETQDGNIYIVLGDTFAIKDQIKEQGGKFNPVHKWFFFNKVEGYNLFPVSVEKAFKDYDIERPIEIELPKVEDTSSFVGKVGEKITLKVKMVGLYFYDSIYGTMKVHSFVDQDDNNLVWKTTSRLACEKDQEVTIQATVKEFQIYKDKKQTVLQRVSIVE